MRPELHFAEKCIFVSGACLCIPKVRSCVGPTLIFECPKIKNVLNCEKCNTGLGLYITSLPIL